MTFALMYNQDDLSNFAGKAQATVNRMPAGDRSLFNSLWDGGLKNWGVAPAAPAQYQSGDTEVKVLVVDAVRQNKAVTMEEFCLLLVRMAVANPGTGTVDPVTGVVDDGASFLISLADDIRNSGGVEPWSG